MTDQPTIDPARTALLVMDYQVGLVQQLSAGDLDADALLARVGAAVTHVRGRGGHVGWVRIAFDEADLDAIPPQSVMAHMAGPERRPSLRTDAPSTQFHPTLRPDAGDVAVRKTRVGAFTTTDLDERLRDRGVTTLILAGISTSGVVLSTTREAMDRDYRVVVLEDACADPAPDVHAFLANVLLPRHTTVIPVAELPTLLHGAPA